jgi:Zn-dependent peptidase ImmA (M78 family)
MSQTSTSERGDALEKQIYEYFEAEINLGRFFAKAECCKLRRKPKYFSRDRESEITFDVSIEIYMPGAVEYSVVIIIECKNYSHAVPVDDAEEFFAKVQQVAAARVKAVIASTASFQAGAREFARSKGIGLLRYFSRAECKWELMRSPGTGCGIDRLDDSTEVTAGLSQQDYKSDVFDLFLQSPQRETHSLKAFLEDMLLDNALSPAQLRRILNPRGKDFDTAPFLEKDQLEEIASKVLAELEYAGGPVPLDQLCEIERERCGLSVHLDVEPSPEYVERQVLGRINFEPLRIEVFRQGTINPGRAKFTLAHELAHHILNHAKYMTGEWCDESDFALERSASIDGTNIARMEFQANYLAGSLLLPRYNVVSDFRSIARGLQLSNRGFGSLYVDDQPCNIQNLAVVARHFTANYGVSHTAATIRLKSLGLLRDARMRSSHKHILASLTNYEVR